MGNDHRSHEGVRGALQIWGVARSRIDALLEQAGAAGADAGRIRTALEWYMAIWDAVDALIARTVSLEQRKLLEMYYADQRSARTIGAATGFSPGHVQDLLNGCIRALERTNAGKLEYLLNWRRRCCRAWALAFLDALPGFDIPPRRERGHAGECPPPWQTRRVDWREIRRILNDKPGRVSGKYGRLTE